MKQNKIKDFFKARYDQLIKNGQSGSMSLGINDAMLRFFETIKNNIPSIKGNTLLDYGCGSGKMTQFLIDYFDVEKYIGVDMIASIIKYNKKIFPKLDFRANEKDIPKVDIVWASFVLQHTPEAEVIILLKKFKKWLNKDGKMYLTNTVIAGQDSETMFYRSSDKYVELFQEAGLECMAVFETSCGGSKVVCFEVTK